MAYISNTVFRILFLSDTCTVFLHSVIRLMVRITDLSPTWMLNLADAIRCRTDRLSTTRPGSIIVVIALGLEITSADCMLSKIYPFVHNVRQSITEIIHERQHTSRFWPPPTELSKASANPKCVNFSNIRIFQPLM